MPCSKCNVEFTLLTWKIKCTDCELYYCSKCLRKLQGLLVCEKCIILNKRPPDREKLMELRAKDLQDYLNKNHISTHGLVEKSELVELFYSRKMPMNKKSQTRLASVLGGSVPNIAAQGQDQINNLKSNLNNMRSYAENAIHNLGRKMGPQENNTQQGPYVQQQQSFQSFVIPNVGQSYGFRTDYYPNYQDPTSSNAAAGCTTSTSVNGEASSRGEASARVETNVTVESSARSETNARAETNGTTETTANVTPHPTPYRHPKLSDYSSIEEFNSLSVKQLKNLLSLNRVDFKGCVEKNELLDRVQRLWNDYHHKKGVFVEGDVENLCKICMDAPLDCVLLECGHVATCIDCGKRLAECPICRQFVTRVVRTFKA